MGGRPREPASPVAVVVGCIQITTTVDGSIMVPERTSGTKTGSSGRLCKESDGHVRLW